MQSLRRKPKKREAVSDNARGVEQEASKKRKKRRAPGQLPSTCGTVCTKIICDSSHSARPSLPWRVKNALQKRGSQMNPRLPCSECQLGMTGTQTCTLFDIQIAHAGFIITDVYCLRSELYIELYFSWPQAKCKLYKVTFSLIICP